MSEVEAPSGRSLPLASSWGHFVWGVISLPLGAFAAGMGYLGASGLKPLAALAGPPAYDGGKLYDLLSNSTMVLSPFLTALLAVLRLRWWQCLLIGAFLGSAVGTVMTAFNPNQLGIEEAFGSQFAWVMAGCAGGLLAAVRRRYQC